ncbi:MAG: amidohydrolase [Acidobacteria bacterium]|nr:amidohydrolase [Acidobacteriota bacterium]
MIIIVRQQWSPVPGILAWVAVSLAGCIGGGRETAREAQPADVIFTGGTVRALGDGDPRQALAIREGTVAALGDASDVDRLRGPDTEVIDLEGKTLLPGFVDHHIHLLNVGLSLLNAELDEEIFLDLSSARSPDEIAGRVRKRAATLPPGAWILGQGWSQGAWGRSRLPTHEVLTEAAPRHPVFLARVDGHAGWANRAALQAAGISAATSDPPGGAILRSAGGEPSGVLLERANELVAAHLPRPADQQIIRAFRLGASAMAARGVVELFDAGFLACPGIVDVNADFERILELIRRTDKEQALPVRVNLMIPAPSVLADKVLADPDRYRNISPRVRVTHIKLFADGALGSRGARLTHPYSDDPTTRGVEWMPAAELRAQVGRAIAAGLDVAVHAIGDEAIRITLDAFEAALAEIPGLSPGRMRIEHFSYASSDDMQRAARMGVVLSVQPNFVYPDEQGLTMEDSRVGAANSSRAYAWVTLSKLGARLAGGSDFFTAPAEPLLNFYCAVTRMSPAGRPPGGWHAGERLSREDAARLFAGGFPAGGRRPRTPALRIGGPADVVVLSADPLVADLSSLLSIRVHTTLLEGQATYRMK